MDLYQQLSHGRILEPIDRMELRRPVQLAPRARRYFFFRGWTRAVDGGTWPFSRMYTARLP